MMLYMLSASGKDKKTNKQKKKQGAAIMPYILLTFTLFFLHACVISSTIVLHPVVHPAAEILHTGMSCTESGTLNRHQVPTVHLRLKHTAIAFPLA